MSDSINILLNLTSAPSAPRVPLTIPKDATATQIRRSAAGATNIPLTTLKLIFRGRLIADSDKASAADEFKLEELCVLHCMGKPLEQAKSTAEPAAAGIPAAFSAGATITAPSAASASSVAPPPSANPLQSALSILRSSCLPPVYLTALKTLDKILDNIKSQPMEEKYRRVKKGNAAFQRRLGGLPGGHDAMLSSGFTVEQEGSEEVYKLSPSADAWPRLVAAKEATALALAEADRATAPLAAPLPMAPPAASVFGAPGMGMGGAGGFPPMVPGMEEAAASMLSDPNSLQRLLQSPMVQQMMRNDPRFANNPQLASQMETMLSDPNAMRQMSQLISDPGMREQMMSMARMQGGGLGVPGASPPASTPIAAAPGHPPIDPATMAAQMQALQSMLGQTGTAQSTGGIQQAQQSQGQHQGNASGSEGDRDMTEEEMIQEAIARSLRES